MQNDPMYDMVHKVLVDYQQTLKDISFRLSDLAQDIDFVIDELDRQGR
jgi:hypothetical protein